MYMYYDDPNSHSHQTLSCLLCTPTIALGCQELWISKESEKNLFTECFNVSIASQTISGYCTFLSISSTAITLSMPVTVQFTESTDLVSSFTQTEIFSCTQPLASGSDLAMTLVQTTSHHVLYKPPILSTTTVVNSSPSSNVTDLGVVVGVVIITTATVVVLAITVSIAVRKSKSNVHNLIVILRKRSYFTLHNISFHVLSLLNMDITLYPFNNREMQKKVHRCTAWTVPLITHVATNN